MVSTSSDVNSALVGTLFSTATASTAVATGMPDLQGRKEHSRLRLHAAEHCSDCS